ncbi:MAG: bifunctional (p)ppGpp synthetase/guanosine-3',5'-bis(diphosphate) 3'-pyrophosphohydrolase [Parcubacteria group bacterium]|nr:bifunctional (p)ppGpp synthetase/guanosine-3',5'-bis(diphosphate) 3'-pyrophosphohydrolase [Parcubacteria group bacterium]
MPLEKLLNTVKKHHPHADLDLIRLAYDFAEKAHEGQKRESGADYFEHPLATAQILAEMKLNTPIVIAGLLHDVPEETSYTIEDLKENFGSEIAGMVKRITKLGKLKYRGIERYVENLRKMFMAIAYDVRVVFIKFADRLHNLKTLDALPPDKQKRIALESMEIFAPIANRLGMGKIKGELEDEAFRYVHPEEYKWVAGLVKDKYRAKEVYIENIGKTIEDDLMKSGINPISIHGRTKHLWSLYQKLLKKDKEIERIYDIVALRIVVKNVSDCYATLGIIHQRWKPLKGRIKDYIAQPKPNGYQSIHTTIFCGDGGIIEIQIRTEKMHEEGEFGIAAHWHYDEKGKLSLTEKKQLWWVKELSKIQKEVSDKQAFLDSLEDLKIDVFQTRIFVFTPQGDVIDLPENSTPIDFAYSVHTEIGNKCTGARINNQMSSVDSRLQSGDVVEIITEKNRKGPNPDWLKIAKTRGAREKIKTQLKVVKKTSI